METPLNIANLCNNIKPGDITHEAVRQSFNEYFGTFNRRLKVYIRQDGCNVLQQLPCFVLKVSFDECRVHLLGPILETFKSLVGKYQLPKKILQMFDLQDENSCLIETLKLERIFHLGQFDDDKTDWDDLKAAYACLLHISDAKSSKPLESLEKKVSQCLPKCDGISEEKMVNVVKMAVDLAWKIVTLVPPALVCHPKEYNQDWMERRSTAWSDEAPSCPTIYFQPVLFYSALGHIGHKGIVGNKINHTTMKTVVYKKTELKEKKYKETEKQSRISNVAQICRIFEEFQRPSPKVEKSRAHGIQISESIQNKVNIFQPKQNPTSSYQSEKEKRLSSACILKSETLQHAKSETQVAGSKRISRQNKIHLIINHVEKFENPLTKFSGTIKEDPSGAKPIQLLPLKQDELLDKDYKDERSQTKIKTGNITPPKCDVIIICSCGDEFDTGIVPSKKVDMGIMANELIRSVPLIQRECKAIQDIITKDNECHVKCVYIDPPKLQSPKEYYINQIKELMQSCKAAGVMIWYTGCSQRGTGNWYFKDGCITFQDIFRLYMNHFRGKMLTLVCDCNYSGQWVRECAKELDALGIPPCGHHCKENEIQIKVMCSSEGEQQAATLSYVDDAVKIRNGNIWFSTWKETRSGRVTAARGDFTMLCCGRKEDAKCEIEPSYGWKWEERLFTDSRRLYLVRGTTGEDRDNVWHYILVEEEKLALFKIRLQAGIIDLANYGEVLYSGLGKEPDELTNRKIALRFQYFMNPRPC